MPSHAGNAFAHDRQCVFGQVDQNRPRLGYGVLAQARRAGRHAQGHVQPQPGLRAFGGSADHADGRRTPEPFHQPTLGVLLARDLSHTHDRKRLLNRCLDHHALTFFLTTGRECLG